MSRVVLLAHDGVRCALPAIQVVQAAARRASDEEGERPIALFRRGPDATVRDERSLVVRTAVGERQLECSDAHFHWLSEERMFALPDVLHDAMALPHVVGVAETDDAAGLIWLVDLERFGGAHLR